MSDFGTDPSLGGQVPDETNAPLLPTRSGAPIIRGDPVTNKTITTEIEKAIVAALTELAAGGELIRFRDIRKRLPAATPWQRLRALGVLEDSEQIVVLMIRGVPWIKLADGFDRTPDHPDVVARRGGARRIPVML